MARGTDLTYVTNKTKVVGLSTLIPTISVPLSNRLITTLFLKNHNLKGKQLEILILALIKNMQHNVTSKFRQPHQSTILFSSSSV